MNKIFLILAAMFWFLKILELPCASQDKDAIFQTSTINALSRGVYDGDITYKDLKKYGDFGIGTFNGLDGEMVALDGKFYQIKAASIAYPVVDSMKTPFAVVTFFEPDRTILVNKIMSFEELQDYLDRLIPSGNIFYSIKIEGLFKYIKLRSVPNQVKPYLPLADVLKNETLFESNGIKGTAVGFRMPGYIQGVNVPGYHFHFITKDKKLGGHLLDCFIEDVRIEIDISSDLYMALPATREFLDADLNKDDN